MERLLVLLVLSLLAGLVALFLQRRRPEPPTAPSYNAPAQLDRGDFAEPTTPILVVCFTSRTCNSCAATWEAVLDGVKGRSQVVTQNVELQKDPAHLHDRYKIDGVPTTLISGADGVVHASFFGQMSANAVSEAID